MPGAAASASHCGSATRLPARLQGLIQQRSLHLDCPAHPVTQRCAQPRLLSLSPSAPCLLCTLPRQAGPPPLPLAGADATCTCWPLSHAAPGCCPCRGKQPCEATRTGTSHSWRGRASSRTPCTLWRSGPSSARTTRPGAATCRAWRSRTAHTLRWGRFPGLGAMQERTAPPEHPAPALLAASPSRQPSPAGPRPDCIPAATPLGPPAALGLCRLWGVLQGAGAGGGPGAAGGQRAGEVRPAEMLPGHAGCPRRLRCCTRTAHPAASSAWRTARLAHWPAGARRRHSS